MFYVSYSTIIILIPSVLYSQLLLLVPTTYFILQSILMKIYHKFYVYDTSSSELFYLIVHIY